jgi:hypothetical protein
MGGEDTISNMMQCNFKMPEVNILFTYSQSADVYVCSAKYTSSLVLWRLSLFDLFTNIDRT